MALLKKRRWTQRRLGRAAGLETAHINKVIHNTADPRLTTAMKIAKALGLQVEDIWRP